MKKLEINKDDLKYNLNLIKDKISGKAEIIAVVKANGMGLDLIQYAHFLIDEGVEILGVANTFEAICLRQNGIDKEILMMSEVYDEEDLTELMKNDIILTIGSLEEKEKIEGIAKALEKEVKVHIKIDTGFARFRFSLS